MSDGKGSHSPPPINATPTKSILKNSGGETDEPDAATAPETNRKCPIGSPPPRANFDEMNIIQTLHPTGKDYGHMKIDEPKTPYNETVDEAAAAVAGTSQARSGGINASMLTAGLNSAVLTPPRVLQDLSQSELSDDEDESPPNTSFQNQRKQHYSEYRVVQAARQKMTLPPGTQAQPPLFPFNDERVRNSAGEYRRGTARTKEIVKYKALKDKIAQGKRLSFAEKRRVHDSEYSISRRLGRHTLALFTGINHETPESQSSEAKAKISKGSPLTFKRRRHLYDRNAIMKAIIELTVVDQTRQCEPQPVNEQEIDNLKSKISRVIPNFFQDMPPKAKIVKGQDLHLSTNEESCRFQISQPWWTIPIFKGGGKKESLEEKIAKGKKLSFEERRDLHYSCEFYRGRNYFYGGKPYKLPPTTPPPKGQTLSFVERRDLQSYEEYTRTAHYYPNRTI